MFHQFYSGHIFIDRKLIFNSVFPFFLYNKTDYFGKNEIETLLTLVMTTRLKYVEPFFFFFFSHKIIFAP